MVAVLFQVPVFPVTLPRCLPVCILAWPSFCLPAAADRSSVHLSPPVSPSPFLMLLLAACTCFPGALHRCSLPPTFLPDLPPTPDCLQPLTVFPSISPPCCPSPTHLPPSASFLSCLCTYDLNVLFYLMLFFFLLICVPRLVHSFFFFLSSACLSVSR